MAITFRLMERDPSHLVQFSEYEVLRDGKRIGYVAGAAHTRFSKHRGRHVVTDRTWTGQTVDRHRATSPVATRREAVTDLINLVADDPTPLSLHPGDCTHQRDEP